MIPSPLQVGGFAHASIYAVQGLSYADGAQRSKKGCIVHKTMSKSPEQELNRPSCYILLGREQQGLSHDTSRQRETKHTQCCATKNAGNAQNNAKTKHDAKGLSLQQLEETLSQTGVAIDATLSKTRHKLWQRLLGSFSHSESLVLVLLESGKVKMHITHRLFRAKALIPIRI